MKTLSKNTFLVGLLSALALVVADVLQAYISGTQMSVNAIIIAAFIALVGYAGRFLTGSANTNVATIGSALLSIVPLITEGAIDWKLIIATMLVKLIGLFTAGTAEKKVQ